jgi:hypothetical protein
LSNRVIASIPVGQAPQALAYVTRAVPEGARTANLTPLGVAASAAHLTLAPPGVTTLQHASTSVTLFEQGLTQVLQAAVTGLEPRQNYILALSATSDGSGALEPLANFTTNPAGAAIVNAVGPIRQAVQDGGNSQRRYLVIAPRIDAGRGAPVQVQIVDP